MNLLEIKDLKKTYSIDKGWFKPKSHIQALKGVSFEVKSKEVLSIVGESGCGKSTTAKILVGMEKPDSGEVLFLNNGSLKNLNTFNQAEWQEYRKKVQMIFQDPYSSLNPRWKVGEIIAEPLFLNSKFSKAEIREKVLEIMQKVGLKSEWINRYSHEFSGGQRQRIGIARALILNPSIVVCDEPVSALDVSIQAQVLNLLLDLQKEMGLTYIFISHDLGVVEHISDRIIVMNNGEIVESGSTDEIISAPKHEYTQKLLNAVPSVEKIKQRFKN
ncbi:ABC transporter ATP-binding protein [Helicobacter cetorum]|uniref:Dipeptide ABC transporter dppF n=2 Tax=Helicobacter cetorum TaxID=138563 RepID=A7LH26_9HELI|nr:ATP-binding cassette domain-containing protein [Helicobacter cetorum]ABS86846.1 dipeptide ABC transporter dppF [Helicobacter cetorum]AFI04912.1 ABC-type transport system, ATP binding protein, putative dipeptide transporter protein 5 [Helicobacter cetorum MIT 00-7128]